MKTKIIGILVVTLLIATALPAVGTLNNSFEGKNHVDKPLSNGFTKTFGGSGLDFGECVQQTSDGGYIIVAETNSYGAGDIDFWLIKTDSNYNIVWDNTYGGSALDFPTFVRQTTDGGYILTGLTASFGAGGNDAWLVKTDADGNETWNKTYGGTDYDFGATVWNTTDDGYIIGGGTMSFGAGDFDYWLIKTDANGTEQWNKTFGGSGVEVCRHMRQTLDGGYIIVGTIYPTEIFGKAVCWLVKTDGDGNKLWDKTIEGIRHSGARGIRQTDDGYIIVGETNSFAIGPIFLGGGDMWLVKTDADGNKVWDKSFGRRIFEDGGWGVELDDDGYIIVGFTTGLGSVIKQTPGVPIYSKAWVVKTDGDGNMIWETEYPRGMCLYIEQTSDGGHIITGGEKPFGEGDAFLIKIG